ncbi:hypothetical protein MPLB_540018 [Mesorhizobium sp. ORS 3324]|nr:hypothetical protein MPLB_540018 [Mesorhizobium sp. ORS 3324]
MPRPGPVPNDGRSWPIPRLCEPVLFRYDASGGRNCYELNTKGRLMGLRRGFQHGGC